MKRLIKSAILFSLFLGYILCTHSTNTLNFLYKTSYLIQLKQQYLHSIISQYKQIIKHHELNNSQEDIEEFFITIVSENSINEKTLPIINSSNFIILKDENLKSYEKTKYIMDILGYDKTLIVKNHDSLLNDFDFPFIDETLNKAFKYKNFSIFYTKDKILNFKDLYLFSKHIEIMNDSNYLPFCIIEKSSLNDSFFKYLKNHLSFFVLEGASTNIYTKDDITCLEISTHEDMFFLYQINLHIKNEKISKIRFKIFPINKFSQTFLTKEELLSFKKKLTKTSNLNLVFDENLDYISFDYDILINN